MKYQVFVDRSAYNDYYADSSLPSGVIAYVKDPVEVHFRTNNIDGEDKEFYMVDSSI